jgi:mannose-1-phosphate guanylyltransferase
MEKAENVLVLEGDFGWNDVGSWDEVHKISKKDQDGNMLLGNSFCLDAKNCLVDSPHRLTTLIGVQDLIVVDTPDALLICSKENAQKVKKAVEMIRRKKMDKYL